MHPAPPRAASGRVPLAVPTLLLGLGSALGGASGAVAALQLHAWLPLPLVLLAARQRAARAPVALLLLGLLLGREAQVAAREPGLLAGLPVPAVHRLHGTVQGAELPAFGAQRLKLRVHAVGDPPVPLRTPATLPLTLRLRGRSTWRWHELVPGSRIRVLALVRRRHDGLRAVATDRRTVTVLAPGAGPDARLARARREASWRFARHLAPRDAGLARALLLGDRARLDTRDRTLMRGTGQAHLLAVSGLHVGLLLGGVILALRLLGAPPRVRWLATIVLAAAYVPFAGAPPSAVRAGLGAAGWCLGALLGRPPRGLAVLALVAFVVLVARPPAAAGLSFQLSFSAVASILLLAPRLRALLLGERFVLPGARPPRAPVRTAFSVSLAAWLGTAPWVALHIGRLCPAGPLLAVPAVPLTAGLLGTGAVVLVAEGAPGVQAAAAHGFTILAGVLREGLGTAHDAHLGALPAARPSVVWIAGYLAALAAAARGEGRVLRRALAAMGVLLGLLLLPPPVPGLTTAHASADTGPYDARAMPSPTPALLLAPASAGWLAGAALGLVLFAALAVRLRWLRPGGAAAAWVLGTAATAAFGLPGLAALLAPFLVATLLGKLPGAGRAEARSLRQVVCNGAPALGGAVLALLGQPEAGAWVFLGALATLGADTCATEVGVRYGGRPFRLAGRGPLAPGASGGVTLLGLLASAGGGALAPLAAFALGGLFAPAVGLLAAAGFGAALLDSVLGGTLQYRGRDPADGTPTERRRVDGRPTERVSGWRWLDNDAVNLVAGLAGALLALALAPLA